MTITGDLRTMADALGQPIADARVLAAMALVGLPVERSEFDLGPSKRTYYTAEDSLADFVFEDERLKSVIVHTQQNQKHGAYASPDALVDGLSGTAERATVLDRFGEPEWTSPKADRFHLDGFYVRFGYVDDRVAEVSVMQRVPGQ